MQPLIAELLIPAPGQNRPPSSEDSLPPHLPQYLQTVLTLLVTVPAGGTDRQTAAAWAASDGAPAGTTESR